MADVKGPLFSLGAKGSLKKTLTYQKTVSGHKVYKHTKPGDVSPFTISPGQRDIRMLCNIIIARWQSFTDDERAVYNDIVKDQGFLMSGWNFFYKKAINDLPRYLGLQAYWSMNEIISGNVEDISGNNLHAALLPDYPTTSPYLINGVTKKFGKALNCTPEGRYAQVADDLILKPSGDFTFHFLVKFHDLTNTQAIINKRFNNSGYYVRLSAGKIYFAVFGTVWKYKGSTNSVVVNTQCDIACVYDKTNSKIYLYINGLPDGTPAVGGEDILHSDQVLGIATARPYVDIQDGNLVIDDIKFYDRALGADEIKALSNLRKVPV